ncbi:VOC family protein [Paraglaciecola marina]|nr:VOC family protein [Paraglaciecola marina]
MKYLHAMIRVRDIAKSLHFYQELLGLTLIKN